jgi:hypothetical protein
VGRFEKIDYRAVLVATAMLALRDAPLEQRPQYPSANGRAWDGMTVDGHGWRAVAIAAGAVHHDE